MQVWVLDSAVGKSGGQLPTDVDNVMAEITKVELPVISREALYKQMEAAGFSLGLRQWMGSNLVPARKGKGYEWAFNLKGAEDMYRYSSTGTLPNCCQSWMPSMIFSMLGH